jgi:hypothetical protein
MVLILLRAKKLCSAEALVARLVEIRLTNLYVCLNVVAIFLPCNLCGTS